LIGDDEVEGAATEEFQGFLAIDGGGGDVAIAGKVLGDEFADDFLVIDDEDAEGAAKLLEDRGGFLFHGDGGGKVNGEVVPTPFWLAISMVPPWRWMIP
jgi:hypothetical protein